MPQNGPSSGPKVALFSDDILKTIHKEKLSWPPKMILRLKSSWAKDGAESAHGRCGG